MLHHHRSKSNAIYPSHEKRRTQHLIMPVSHRRMLQIHSNMSSNCALHRRLVMLH